MEVSATNAASALAAGTGATSTGSAQPPTLDYKAFLKLFVTQMQNQDPLNPMESTEYTAQLAQFSSLEQSIESNKKLDGLMSQLALSQANSLIGRTATSADGTVSGVVSSVTVLSDGAVANLTDGKKLPLGAGLTIK